ncbi:Hypothetical protein LBF_3342 [Leptospira biflexa serovar Patoc strain 'Patoc 1 (Ames)']|nr:Hypothetical protein LBF_3342 [Leptospira biflexa serovar Patoc strain 'Patoc 1 (Ames)']
MKFTRIKDKFEKIKTYILTDEAAKIFAVLPLFFSWVPIFTWKRQFPEFVTISLYSAINTCLFLLGLVLAQILSFLPFLGLYLAATIHLLSILLYLGIGGFLIYSIRLQKTIVIPVLLDWVKMLQAFIAPIAQLDRVSDYGSEG